MIKTIKQNWIWILLCFVSISILFSWYYFGRWSFDEQGNIYNLFGKQLNKRQDECIESVREFCYNIHKENNEFGVNTKEYNECKFETFHNRCSQLDCLRFYGYNVENPEILTEENAQELVNKSYLEPRILDCFLMEN